MGKSWDRMNRRRGELIDKKIDGSITETEQRELDKMQDYVDQVISEKFSRDLTWLDELEMKVARLLAEKERTDAARE